MPNSRPYATFQEGLIGSDEAPLESTYQFPTVEGGSVQVPRQSKVQYAGMELLGRDSVDWHEPIQKNFVLLAGLLQKMNDRILDLEDQVGDLTFLLASEGEETPGTPALPLPPLIIQASQYRTTLIVGGSAPLGSTVKLYLDNVFISDTVASVNTGAWDLEIVGVKNPPYVLSAVSKVEDRISPISLPYPVTTANTGGVNDPNNLPKLELIIPPLDSFEEVETTPENLLSPDSGSVLEYFTEQYNSSEYAATLLTNGELGEDNEWASEWRPNSPIEFIYSFSEGSESTLQEAVIHTGVAGGRYFSEDIEIWASQDGSTYEKIAEGSLPNYYGSITLPLQGYVASKVKLVIKSGHRNDYWMLGDFTLIGSEVTSDQEVPSLTVDMTISGLNTLTNSTMLGVVFFDEAGNPLRGQGVFSNNKDLTNNQVIPIYVPIPDHARSWGFYLGPDYKKYNPPLNTEKETYFHDSPLGGFYTMDEEGTLFKTSRIYNTVLFSKPPRNSDNKVVFHSEVDGLWKIDDTGLKTSNWSMSINNLKYVK